MPGLLRTSAQLGNAASGRCPPLALSAGTAGSSGIWSKHRDGVTFDQLQKFWSELSPHTRQELLKIDKQMLFEQARKNLYCSRCNGLLLEVFSQIVVYGKSLHQEGFSINSPTKAGDAESDFDEEPHNFQDPYVHPWGGLLATRDGALTLLDCYIYEKSLKVLQNVFDSARARERERELLYPDACGGGGRGWISQSIATYTRGHGTRETCALHTARLSCDTLVDFWSALGDETRLSLLSMKEEDFIERLMYRFDSKRFCRDCRRNVIREFKELKELKRMRKEPRCTNWFCVADTAFQYEVSDDTVEADWHEYFTDSIVTYHHFEWAIGTGEGKSDILEFEDVGISGRVQASGLELADLSACFITLRAWRLDGRCTEIIVKAHALKGQPCVHRRLVVGDGFVTITKGENIRQFFEHAEEAEEEEDDDSVDKDGNEVDDDGFRPQKHAKSPELAREFLLDAATVIFKEQVEKAFREGTARQNAHSVFVCLSLKLLEERVLVACKEIISWEKQIKLLEEEEKEKREEEERKERRRLKEREKKLRRKERLKEKERERERKNTESKSLTPAVPSTPMSELSSSTMHGQPCIIDSNNSLRNTDAFLSRFDSSSDVDKCSSVYNMTKDSSEGDSTLCVLEQSKSSGQQLQCKNSLIEMASESCQKHLPAWNEGAELPNESEKGFHRCVMASTRYTSGDYRQVRGNASKTNVRNLGIRFTEKFHPNSRMCDRYEFHQCGVNQHTDHRTKDGQRTSTVKSDREVKIINRADTFDTKRQFYQRGKYGHGCYVPENLLNSNSKGKFSSGSIQRSRGGCLKQIWEPMDSKKCFRSNSYADSVSRPMKMEFEAENILDGSSTQEGPESPDRLSRVSSNLIQVDDLVQHQHAKSNFSAGSDNFDPKTCSNFKSKNDSDQQVHSCPSTSALSNSHDLMSSSSSENCSSYLSEGDNSTSSSSNQNTESSSISDSEVASQHSDGRELSTCNDTFEDRLNETDGDKLITNGCPIKRSATGSPTTSCKSAFLQEETTKAVHNADNGSVGYDTTHQHHMPPIPSVFPPAAVGYGNQCPWTALPGNGIVTFAQSNQYMLPCHLGYGLPMPPSSDFHLQYNAIQPLTGPMVTMEPHRPCQFAEVNVARMNQWNGQSRSIKSSKIQGGYMPDGRPFLHPIGSKQHSPKPQSTDGDLVGNAAKSCSDTPSFSLFHFDGPVAVAGPGGCNAHPSHPEGEITSGFRSNVLEERSDDTCKRKETEMEEYNLFASSYSEIFSFLR